VGGRARELVGAVVVGEEGVHGGRPVVGEAEVSWAARCALRCGFGFADLDGGGRRSWPGSRPERRGGGMEMGVSGRRGRSRSVLLEWFGRSLVVWTGRRARAQNI
jgi:hypothetical protein